MRWLIREWFLYLASLFVLDYFFTWILISNRESLLAAATLLFLLNTIGKPILKILWLPINIITLGLFSWVLNIIVILIVILLIPGFHMSAFELPAFTIWRFAVPEIHLKLFWTYFVFSFILSWMVGFLRWLLVEE